MSEFFGTNDALSAIIKARSNREGILVIPIPENTAKVLTEYVGWARSKKKKGRRRESYASSYENLVSLLRTDCQRHIEDFARKCDKAMHPIGDA